MLFKHFHDKTQWHQGCLIELLEAASGMPKRQCDFTIIVLVDGLEGGSADPIGAASGTLRMQCICFDHYILDDIKAGCLTLVMLLQGC